MSNVNYTNAKKIFDKDRDSKVERRLLLDLSYKLTKTEISINHFPSYKFDTKFEKRLVTLNNKIKAMIKVIEDKVDK